MKFSANDKNFLVNLFLSLGIGTIFGGIPILFAPSFIGVPTGMVFASIGFWGSGWIQWKPFKED